MKARLTSAAARLLSQRLVRLVLAAGVAVALIAGLGGLAQARTVSQVADAGRSGPVTVARPQAAAPPVLEVQTCTGSSFCLATGSYSKPGHPYIPVLEQWNGKAWRIIPNPSGFEGQITCGGPSFCLAVVSAPKDSARDVVWNGRAWRAFKPQPPDVGDVSCVSPTFCVTLNNSEYPFGYVGWNGKTWQAMTQDSGGCGGAWCTYQTPTCASTTDCWDSGTYCQDSDCDGGLIYFDDTWNGTAWNQSPTGRGFSADVACTGRSFCLALNPPSHAAITNDWGATWQKAATNLAAACRHLASCALPADPACGSPRFCLALPSADPTAALIWNGVKWGVKPLALVSGRLPKLTNLACGSPSNCVATGTYQLTPRSTPRPVAEHWNGKAWQVTPVVIP
jgi:hypothetical protein